MAFWNRYPYTDFHELNADKLFLEMSQLKHQVEEFTARVIAMEDDVADLQTRMTSAEGRLTTAEEDIDALEGRAGAAEDRLDAIEGSNIMDAEMLSRVTTIIHGSDQVTINFEKDTYTDGEKTSSYDSAPINATTDTRAGVMIPAQKKKLDAFSVDSNGNAEFTGHVAGQTPTNQNEFTTKQYVDSLAISGSADVTFNTSAQMVLSAWSGKATVNGILAGSMGYMLGLQYGAMREVDLGIELTMTQAVSSGAIASCQINDNYTNQYAEFYLPAIKNGSDQVLLRCYFPAPGPYQDPADDCRFVIMCPASESFAVGDVIRLVGVVTFITA